jgi:general secretion pathway protein A
MYLSHWKLAESPFARRMDVHQFFPSSTHQEALARLEFLVSHHRPLGLLLGPGGTGKSLLLYKLAHRLSRRGVRVALATLVGATAEDVLWCLAAQLGCGDRADIPPARLWTRLVDRIEENRRLHRSTVFLLDDIDEAATEVQSLLIRLAHADPTAHAQHSLVLACDSARIDHVTSQLLDLVDLRVSIDPWEGAETAEYLKSAMVNAGCSEGVFADTAIAEIHALTGGVPRQVNRLADLALVAAAGQQSDHVDGETVAAVAGELVACS